MAVTVFWWHWIAQWRIIATNPTCHNNKFLHNIYHISLHQLSDWWARCCSTATITYCKLTPYTPSRWVLAMGHINRKPRRDGTAEKFRLSRLYCSSRREVSDRFSVICPLPKWLLTQIFHLDRQTRILPIALYSPPRRAAERGCRGKHVVFP